VSVTPRCALGAFALSVALAGCGAAVGGTATQGGSSDASAIEQLKGIEQEIEQRSNGLFKALDDADALIADLAATRARLDLSPEQFAAQVSGSSGPAASAEVGAGVQAEIEGVKERLGAVALALQETPREAEKLLAAIAEAVTKVPALAAEATASAQVTINNPFADADAKAKANADVAALDGLPTRIVQTLKEAQAKVATLPQRTTATSAAFAAAMPGVPVAELARNAPAKVNAAVVPEGGSAGATAGEHLSISASAAIDLALPTLAAGAERVRGRFDRAQNVWLDLTRATREASHGPGWTRQALVGAMQNAPLALPNGSKPPVETVRSLSALAGRATRSLAELAAVDRDVTALNAAIRRTGAELPNWRDLARQDAQAIVDLPSASEVEKRRARSELDSLGAREAEVAAGLQRIRDQIAPWPAKAELTIATLLQELSPGALDLTAMASSRETINAPLDPLPMIAPTPRLAIDRTSSAPIAADSARTGATRDETDRGGSNAAWYVTSAVLAAATLGAASYVVERNSILADCHSRPPGFGCANTDVINDQRIGGIVATATLGAGALTTLIVALLSGDSAEAETVRAMSCLMSANGAAVCNARF